MTYGTNGTSRTPEVSVVIPMRDEEAYIGRCLESLVSQDYSAERFEIIVVDGMSRDNSGEIVRGFVEGSPEVWLLDNPGLITPVALNLGIAAARGDVIIILGSHSYVERDFIRRNVEALEQTGADCVGGRIETVSDSRIGRVVSLAMSSPFGVGNARFRTSGKPGFVDTVAFGAYRRQVFDLVGLFDEELIRNQDDEFNYRLRKAGGRIYLDPSIRSFYWSRPSLTTLWKQYYQYGHWKIRLLKKHGRLPAGRNLVPAIALLFFAGSVTATVVNPRLAWLPLSLLAVYAGLTLAFTLKIALRNGPDCLMLPLAFATLHLSYATGFISGLPGLVRGRSR